MSFVVEVDEDVGAQTFTKMMENENRIDVLHDTCKRANKGLAVQSWCTPLALVRAGNSSLVLPSHVVTWATMRALCLDKETQGVSKASV